MKSNQPWFVVLILAVVFGVGGDWPRFRGGDSNSIALDAKPPTELSEGNVAWKKELPGRGPSSPIVVDGKVLVTCSDGVKQDRIYVVCFDVDSGDELWRRQLWATGRTASHPTSANAAPTPASDGEAIYAFYSSNDLACIELDGTLRWYRGLAFDYPKAGNDIGMASSPVIVGDVVVVQIENQGDSFATGINCKTGKTIWRLDREPVANWSSPVPLTAVGSDAPSGVLLQSPSGLTAVDAATGSVLWTHESGCDGTSSSVSRPGRIYFPSSDGITALDTTKREPETIWNARRLRPGAASTIVDGNQVYAVNRSGVLTCASAVDGQQLWQQRLKGSFWGTPAIAAGHMYLVSQEGDLQIVKLSKDAAEVVSEFSLKEKIQGSIAIADNAIFIRSDAHLWKLAH
ncbi:MAG TPA: pyrrolo-quinoline quinone [Planctomycetes bacterium]|nr:pyrrolo-quinoline quinone [Planctomycetaceae bacterium]HIM28478.1 pyrrolo-quinoline quinone [Planctomycetota bacterium]